MRWFFLTLPLVHNVKLGFAHCAQGNLKELRENRGPISNFYNVIL